MLTIKAVNPFYTHLGNIMLSERIQSPKYHVFYLYEMSRAGKSIETEKGLVVHCHLNLT